MVTTVKCAGFEGEFDSHLVIHGPDHDGDFTISQSLSKEESKNDIKFSVKACIGISEAARLYEALGKYLVSRRKLDPHTEQSNKKKLDLKKYVGL